MSLTRKFLAAMGIEADKIDEIITAHSETVDALKEQRDSFKKDAETLSEVQKQLSEAEEKVKELTDANKGNSGFEKKYNDLKKEYDDYKAGKEKEAEDAKIRNAYRNLLKDAGVSEKRLDAIIKVSDLSAVKLDQDGKIEGADALTETIKKDWSDFIPTEGEEGAKTPTPPTGSGKSNSSNYERAAKIAHQYHVERFGEDKEVN